MARGATETPTNPSLVAPPPGAKRCTQERFSWQEGDAGRRPLGTLATEMRAEPLPLSEPHPAGFLPAASCTPIALLACSQPRLSRGCCFAVGDGLAHVSWKGRFASPGASEVLLRCPLPSCAAPARLLPARGVGIRRRAGAGFALGGGGGGETRRSQAWVAELERRGLEALQGKEPAPGLSVWLLPQEASVPGAGLGFSHQASTLQPWGGRCLPSPCCGRPGAGADWLLGPRRGGAGFPPCPHVLKTVLGLGLSVIAGGRDAFVESWCGVELHFRTWLGKTRVQAPPPPRGWRGAQS